MAAEDASAGELPSIGVQTRKARRCVLTLAKAVNPRLRLRLWQPRRSFEDLNESFGPGCDVAERPS